MSKHQVIYTSCRKGMYGINDGQNIFSHDSGVKGENECNKTVGKFFTYNTPTPTIELMRMWFPEYPNDSWKEHLYPREERSEDGKLVNEGIWSNDTVQFPWHEEIAPRCPRSFIYEGLDENQAALALQTFLGRDYAGAHTRFGNFMSHVVWFDKEELDTYPCEYYGSTMLRSSMEFEEVNNPERPAFLPDVEMQCGYQVDFDTVVNFLAQDPDRNDLYLDMLHAMLQYSNDHKRVLICDEQDNIIYWIAALQYAFPLRNILNVNFNTYCSDPVRSTSARICGVLPYGTSYKYHENSSLNFVYDFYENQHERFDNSDPFFDFISTAMAFSRDSLTDFHSFLTEGYSYDQVDEEILNAYALYELFSDGMGRFTEERLARALSFADAYATTVEHKRVIAQLLDDSSIMDCSDNLFLSVVRYVLKDVKALSRDQFEKVRSIMTERVLHNISNPSVSAISLERFYNTVDETCKTNGFNLFGEFLRVQNYPKFSKYIAGCADFDKLNYIVRIMISYVKDARIPVDSEFNETEIGKLYMSIISSAYAKNPSTGLRLSNTILQDAVSHCSILVNMTLNLENMIRGIANEDQEIAKLWQVSNQLLCEHCSDQYETVYRILMKVEYYAQIYDLYANAMSKVTSLDDGYRIFKEHWMAVVKESAVYSNDYMHDVLRVYYSLLRRMRGENSSRYCSSLLQMIIKNKMQLEFTEELIALVTKEMPLSKEADTQLVMQILAYQNQYCGGRIDNKIKLLVMAMLIDQKSATVPKTTLLGQMDELCSDGNADLSTMHSEDVQSYLNWLMQPIFRMCRSNYAASDILRLYGMTTKQIKEFILELTKLFVKLLKDEDSIPEFCCYLTGILQDYPQLGLNTEIGRMLCNLNKNKMQKLDEAITAAKPPHVAAKAWEEIKEVAGNTNPILNSISSFFKKIKK